MLLHYAQVKLIYGMLPINIPFKRKLFIVDFAGCVCGGDVLLQHRSQSELRQLPPAQAFNSPSSRSRFGERQQQQRQQRQQQRAERVRHAERLLRRQGVPGGPVLPQRNLAEGGNRATEK